MSLLKACNGGSVVDPPVDLTENLVAHYLLNNSADDSHGTYDGTPLGGVDFQGDVASFDGVDDDITTPYSLVDTNTVDKPFTLSIWYKRNGTVSQGTGSTSDKHPIFASGQDDALGDFNFDFSVNMDTGAVATQICSGSYENRIICYMVGVPGVTVGYHHYVVSYDGSKSGGGIKLYCDGVELTTTITTQGTYVGMNIEPLLIGSFLKNDSVSYRRANGNSSNFRIYSDVKDQTFVTALHEEGYYPKPLPLPTTDGLLAHYPLTGTAEDVTGNYDGVEVGNTYVSDAEFGSVASFDGVDDYITLHTMSTTIGSIMSFSWWTYSDGTSWGFAHRDDVTTLYQITAQSGVIKVQLRTSISSIETITSSETLNADEWNCCQVIVDLTTKNVTLYVNGVFDSTTSISSEHLFDSALTFIGAYHNGSIVIPTPANKMSNNRIYNRALTTQEITDIYNYEKNFRPIDIDDGLVAYYPLANNSLDNYYNELDGVDSAMTYDGLSGVFDGTTSKISNLSFPNYSTLTACSLSMWVSCDMSIASNFVNIDNNSGLRLRSLNGNLQVLNNGAGSNFMANRIIATNEMVHIVVVNDATGLYLYLDAILDNSNNTPLQSSSTSTLGLFLGHYTDASASTELLDGTLARVRIYNKAITAEQVEVLYNTEKGDFI